jgi:hypothetical protein
MLIFGYSVFLWITRILLHSKAAKERIATASSTLQSAITLAERKLMGKIVLEHWMKELEQSTRGQGNRFGLNVKT